jgi:hypothetical protein
MNGRGEPHPGSREERIAYNQAWARDLNERKARWMDAGDPAAGFRCECWQADCGARIGLNEREWLEVRSNPRRFAVAPDHVAIELEAVVTEYPHFWLVEKEGEAGDLAAGLA